MTTRKAGHYWVKDSDYQWRIAVWSIYGESDSCWWYPGLETSFKDSDFVEIGDYIEIPNKYRHN